MRTYFNLNKITSKITFIFKEEGFFIFAKRLIAFLLFYILTSLNINNAKLKLFKKLKNSKKDKRIFLLGNGPSLNKTPLFLLKNENVFISNRFGLLLERLDFVPQYYACIDDRVLSTISEDIFELSDKVEHIFLPLIHPSSGKNFYKVFKKIKNAYWLILNKFGYSIDLPYAGINKSVTNCSLQIAAYMGFKEIYLLGVDMDYEDHKSVIKENNRDWTSQEDDDPNHFDPRYFGKGTQYHHPRLDETFKKWEEAKTFFEEKGVKIYNATIGGKLEVFERVDFNNLFQYSEQEEMLLFLSKFNITKYISNNLNDYFKEAEKIDRYHQWDNSKYYIISDAETGVKIIPKVIFEYIPYGPIFGQYLFIKR